MNKSPSSSKPSTPPTKPATPNRPSTPKKEEERKSREEERQVLFEGNSTNSIIETKSIKRTTRCRKEEGITGGKETKGGGRETGAINALLCFLKPTAAD